MHQGVKLLTLGAIAGCVPLASSAADFTANINALRESSEYSFVSSDVDFRFGWLASAVDDASNAATHMLIEGLMPVADDPTVVSSNYQAINISDGNVQDVGVVMLKLPAGASVPEGSAASPIVGVVQRAGPWSDYASTVPATSVGNSSGTSGYDDAAGTLSLSLSRGETESFSGSADYTVVDVDTIDVAAFSLSDGTTSYNFLPLTMVRDGARFYGLLQSADESVGYDSLLFSIEMVDLPDVDDDGIPDISDPDVEEPSGGLPLSADWAFYQDMGWIYGYSSTWGYSIWMGAIYTANYPWIYHAALGYFYHAGGRAETGIWLYSAAGVWNFSIDTYGGWYRYPPYGDDDWNNFLDPQ